MASFPIRSSVEIRSVQKWIEWIDSLSKLPPPNLKQLKAFQNGTE